MATQESQEIKYCPVCRTLPLHTVAFGVEIPPMEYHLSDDDGYVDADNDKQFDKCALYFLVKSLGKIWSGKEVFPALPDPARPRLDYTCGGRLELEVRTDHTAPIANLRPPQSSLAVHSDPRHPAVVARLQEWLQSCGSRHEGCHVDDISLLPTRVLDTESVLDSEGVPSSAFVKLVETSDDQRGSYVALSHCWGHSNRFVTTRNNVEDMKSGFLLQRAPATFRDAVEVCRQLGIRYLWIDSLCIIQGDARDWQMESSRMGGVYREATVVLSAASATADDQGFLQPRLTTHSILRLLSPTGESTEVYLQAKGPHDYWERQSTRTQPLDTRGWCLQEAYLARRQVRFLDRQILWHCRDAQFYESSLDKTFSLVGAGTKITINYLFRGTVPRRHRTFNLMTPYQGWYRMVREYTHRKLTYASDKLSALSGLASEVAKHDQGRYCVGVWWEDVAFGICWKKESTLSKMDEYIAPSWSWAAVDGPVEFIDANERYLTQTTPTLMAPVVIDDFHVQNRGSYEYGQVESAWLKLQAPMACLERVDEILQISGMELADKTELSFDFEGEDIGELTALFLMRRLDNAQETQPIHMGREKRTLGVILFGLIIRAVPHRAEKCKELGLQDEARVYERVGFFRILTSESREIGFWGDNVNSIILV